MGAADGKSVRNHAVYLITQMYTALMTHAVKILSKHG